MKTRFISFLIFYIVSGSVFCQNKVAILDFENASNISKYDGFGKALANMLITDLKNNIHPRKMTFVERSQLNKILDEQNLQKSKNFDNSTTVNFGKLAGVDYVILGDVYVLDGITNISARLVNVETSEIEYSKETNGEITKWLTLKSKLAEELSEALNNPVVIEDDLKVKPTNEGVISQYSMLLDKIDRGDIESAKELADMLASVQPDFKYFDELKRDIEQLKKQVKENTKNISVLKKSGGLVIDASTLNELKNNLKSTLLSYDEKLEIIKSIIINFGESINNYPMNEDLKFIEYNVKLSSNINYYESLTDNVHKDLFFDFLKQESTIMINKIRLFDYYEDYISDETVVKLILAYIEILKIEYRRISTPFILESEFIFLNLLYATPFYPNGIGTKRDRKIFSEDYKNLRISVLNNMFNSQKKELGVNLDVLNLLQIYYTENYDDLVETNENLDVGLERDFLIKLIPHIILDRHNQETRNKIKKDFFKYYNISEHGFYDSLEELNIPLLIKNNKVLISYDEKITSHKAIKFYTSKTNVNSSGIKYLYNISSNKILFSNDFELFKPLVENYIEIKKKIYFDFQLHNFNSTKEIENQLYINKFEEFNNYDEFIKYFNSIEYPPVKYDFNNYLVCDFIPEGTQVSFSTSDTYFKEYIVINSGGKLRNNEIVLPDKVSKNSKFNLVFVDPEREIRFVNPSHFEFIGLNKDYKDTDTENWHSKKNKMWSAIYHINRNLMDKDHIDYRWDFDTGLDSLNISRIEVLLEYMKEKNEEELIEIENIFPSKRKEYLDDQLKKEKIKKQELLRQENLIQETNSYLNKLMAFVEKDVFSYIDLPTNELIDIYRWRNGLKEHLSENGRPVEGASNYELFEFFNTAFNELANPEKKISKERLSRAIIYNSIVFDFFNNINDYIDNENTLEKNKLTIQRPYYLNSFEIDVEEFRNASRINTAHSLLVYSVNYDKSLFNKAMELYSRELMYKFGDSFLNLSSEDMIKVDLNDFIELGLIDEITKNKVLENL